MKMAITSKPSTLLFLSCLLVFAATSALSDKGEDPRLGECKQQCSEQQGYSPSQQRQCQQQCEDYYGQQHGNGEAEQQLEQCQRQCREGRRSESQRGECEQSCQEQYRRQKEGERDPEQQYEQCQDQCRSQRPGQQQECQQQCQDEYRRQKEEGRGGEGNQEGGNPFYYSPDRFIERIRTQEGHFRVIERFSEKSELLNGIDIYRFGVLEANPNTFVTPHHCDCEAVFYIANGRGTINMLRNQNRESYNVRKGDVLRVRAGSVVYILNSDNNEKLSIAQLLLPDFAPGRFEEFYGAGGEDPETFFRTFSNEILEAAFNIPKEKLDRVFRQQSKGAIMKASPEQIKAMSGHGSSSEGSRGQSRGPYNLFSKHPTHANQHGQLHEAYPNDYEQLRELNIAVSLANISRGSMEAPMYNSKVTKISMVLEGTGYYEMACPHISASGQEREEEKGGQQRQTGQRYQRVSAPLSRGAVFVVPAGHPTMIVASRNQNLQIVCFEINAQGNERNFLAGQNNILNQLEKEAKELSFNVPAREVDEVFKAQKDSVFLAGPEQSQMGKEGGGRGEGPLESILDFVSF